MAMSLYSFDPTKVGQSLTTQITGAYYIAPEVGGRTFLPRSATPATRIDAVYRPSTQNASIQLAWFANPVENAYIYTPGQPYSDTLYIDTSTSLSKYGIELYQALTYGGLYTLTATPKVQGVIYNEYYPYPITANSTQYDGIVIQGDGYFYYVTASSNGTSVATLTRATGGDVVDFGETRRPFPPLFYGNFFGNAEPGDITQYYLYGDSGLMDTTTIVGVADRVGLRPAIGPAAQGSYLIDLYNGSSLIRSWAFTPKVSAGYSLKGLSFTDGGAVAVVPGGDIVNMVGTSLWCVFVEPLPYTYTLRDQAGSVLGSVDNLQLVGTTSISYNNGNVRWILSTTNGSVEKIYKWSPPTGQLFAGATTSAGDILPPGVTVPVSWNASVTVTIVTEDIPPSVDEINIRLYRCSADPTRLDKSDYLSDRLTVTGVCRQPIDMLNPQIAIELSSTPQYNYAYIAALSRWYWIMWEHITADLWLAKMSVDVLMSYKDEILTDGLNNIALRRAPLGAFSDPMLYDDRLPTTAEKTLTTITFPRPLYRYTDTCYVIMEVVP